jgi:hypothetical protein
MKTVTPELTALLASRRFLTANLYTLTLLNGTAYRVTDAPDFDASWNNQAFSYTGLTLARGTVTQSIGIEVDSVDVTLTTGATETLQGLPIPHFVRNGGFNGARLLIQRAFFAIDSGGNVSPTATGVIFTFEGRVAEPSPSRTQVTFKVVADTELLNKQVPLNTITASCMNVVYDGRCGKSRDDYSHKGTVATASNAHIACGLTQPDGYYDNGTVAFTSGQNAGAKRTVKAYTAGLLTLSTGFDFAPAAGDSFTAVAGCDLSAAVCASRFGNLPNRRALPWVPVYEENL